MKFSGDLRGLNKPLNGPKAGFPYGKALFIGVVVLLCVASCYQLWRDGVPY